MEWNFKEFGLLLFKALLKDYIAEVKCLVLIFSFKTSQLWRVKIALILKYIKTLLLGSQCWHTFDLCVYLVFRVFTPSLCLIPSTLPGFHCFLKLVFLTWSYLSYSNNTFWYVFSSTCWEFLIQLPFFFFFFRSLIFFFGAPYSHYIFIVRHNWWNLGNGRKSLNRASLQG